jgi:hypothetical protein
MLAKVETVKIEISGDVDYDCTACHGTSRIICTHTGTGRDADGWCTTCDSPTDQPVQCSCECVWR